MKCWRFHFLSLGIWGWAGRWPGLPTWLQCTHHSWEQFLEWWEIEPL